MGFVKIMRDGNIATVQENVFRNEYERNGWFLVNDGQQDDEWETVEKPQLHKKPVGEMARDELMEMALKLGIQTDGKSNTKLREAIRAAQG